MILKDYLIRLIEQLAFVLARVFKLQVQGQYQAALGIIDQAMRDFLGFNSEFINSFDVDELLTILESTSGFEAGKAIVLADLIKAEGDVLQAQEKLDAAAARYTKALWCYLEVARREGIDVLGERRAKLAEVASRLRDYVLPQALNQRLFEHYRTENQAAEAVRVFGDLVEQNPDFELLSAGLQFHQELAELTDARLLELGLTRQEVADRVRELKALKARQSGKRTGSRKK